MPPKRKSAQYEEDLATYEELKAQYDKDLATYEELKTQYDKDKAAYDDALKKYSSEILHGRAMQLPLLRKSTASCSSPRQQ